MHEDVQRFSFVFANSLFPGIDYLQRIMSGQSLMRFLHRIILTFIFMTDCSKAFSQLNPLFVGDDLVDVITI